MTKTQLIELVKRRLGFPMVKVELDDTQISDHIDYARNLFIKWAVGHATQEYYFTMPLSANVISYPMPDGCVEVVGYDTEILGGGINTLFTVNNVLYNLGYYDYLTMFGSDTYSLVTYHLARDMLETIDRYSVDKFNFHYHKYSNILEINPAPDTTDTTSYLLIRAWFIEGYLPWSTAALDLGATTTALQGIYSEPWILDYTEALSKISLGHIRNKFSNFASLGNIGLALDGDSLISEGREDKEKLEETLRLEEAYEGYGIEIGYM